MSIQDQIEKLQRASPPPRPRAAHGQWVEPAWIVRGLVEAGHQVTDACRYVIGSMDLDVEEGKAIRSLRQAYYAVRDKEFWPDDMKKASEDFVV